MATILVVLIQAAFLGTASAEVHKCKLEDGSTLFSEEPCEDGGTIEFNRFERTYNEYEKAKMQLEQRKKELALTERYWREQAATLATDDDIDQMTTYAVIIGRATGCGINTENESRRVGAWMDRRFPPGSSDQKIYLPIFMAGVQQHAQNQSNGNSPDSCSAVRQVYSTMPWP